MVYLDANLILASPLGRGGTRRLATGVGEGCLIIHYPINASICLQAMLFYFILKKLELVYLDANLILASPHGRGGTRRLATGVGEGCLTIYYPINASICLQAMLFYFILKKLELVYLDANLILASPHGRGGTRRLATGVGEGYLSIHYFINASICLQAMMLPAVRSRP